MQASVWNRCVRQLRSDLSEQQFNTWIRPLQAVEDNLSLRLLAPNHFVVDWVNANCIDKINRLADGNGQPTNFAITVEVGTARPAEPDVQRSRRAVAEPMSPSGLIGGKLDPILTFDRFVEGKSNQLARAHRPDLWPAGVLKSCGRRASPYAREIHVF